MEFSEIEKRRIEKLVNGFLEKRRPPPDLRRQLDLGFRLEGPSLLLSEIRPVWNDSNQYMESPVAKATFVKTRKIWRVFWHRADLKWHGYPPCPEVQSVEEFLFLVDRDENHCFWG
jgi:hypothetical protein